jgi:putative NADH-flavin reductase
MYGTYKPETRGRSSVKVAVLGATGRTGRLVIDELLRRRHAAVALVRDPALAALPDPVRLERGDARDAAALRNLVTGTDAVVSALGPVRGDRTLHREVAPLLREAMRAAGVRRFVGISGAGIDVPGDTKSARDRLVSALIQRFGGNAARDKADEHRTWADSDLTWTLVRPPRLVDDPGTGHVEHSAHRSARRTKLTRADLAGFVVDCLEQGLHLREAPLVGQG